MPRTNAEPALQMNSPAGSFDVEKKHVAYGLERNCIHRIEKPTSKLDKRDFIFQQPIPAIKFNIITIYNAIDIYWGKYSIRST